MLMTCFGQYENFYLIFINSISILISNFAQNELLSGFIYIDHQAFFMTKRKQAVKVIRGKASCTSRVLDARRQDECKSEMRTAFFNNCQYGYAYCTQESHTRAHWNYAYVCVILRRFHEPSIRTSSDNIFALYQQPIIT